MTTTPTPRVHLSDELPVDALFNTPIDPPDPPMQPGDGLVWLVILGISCAVAIAATVWLYNAIFN